MLFVLFLLLAFSLNPNEDYVIWEKLAGGGKRPLFWIHPGTDSYATFNVSAFSIGKEDSNYFFSVWNGSNAKFVITNDGKVGIGTEDPEYNFEVHTERQGIMTFSYKTYPYKMWFRYYDGKDQYGNILPYAGLGIGWGGHGVTLKVGALQVGCNFADTFVDYHDIYTCGDIFYKGIFQDVSDIRFKKNISDIRYGLKEVLQLHPVSFYLKDDKRQRKRFGFVAQEVQSIIPEIVTNRSDGLYLATTELIPVLVKAIQEQQAIMENQSKKIDELEERIGKLEKIIESQSQG